MKHSGNDDRTKGRVIHWAGYYDALLQVLMLGKDRAIREMTLELAKVGMGEKVLDVGCGTGSLAILAKSRVGVEGRVEGIDPSPEMIQVARKKSARAGMEVGFRIGGIESIPFPDDSFDVVLSSLMVHHLPDDVKREGLREVRRVLRPGGRLLVVDLEPRGGSFTKLLFNHLIGHSRLEGNVTMLPDRLREAGFEDVEVGVTQYSSLSYALAVTGDG